MNFDPGRIAAQVNALWDTFAGILLVAAGLTVAVVGFLAVRAVWSRNPKEIVGFGLVQAGVTVAIVTGVYDFFHLVLDMPPVEAAILAVFIEAVVWGAVGMVFAHGRAPGSAGFGDAAGLFWTAAVGGGVLAVLGSSSMASAVGRVVIVALGTYMWYLRLLQRTNRSGQRSRWRWTPKRLLLAVGAMAPEDADVETEAREWQVRRLARAIRWSNAQWPWSAAGGWMLTRRAEVTSEDVLAEARRRWAAAYVLREESRADSPTMASVIADVVAGQIGGHPVDMSAGHQAPATGHGGVDIPAAAVDTPNGHRDRTPTAAGGGQRPDTTAAADPTRRQSRVLNLLAQDDPRLTQKDIARKLRVSDKTVQRELRDLRRTFGVRTDAELRSIAGGHVRPAGVDTRPATTRNDSVDMPVNGTAVTTGHAPPPKADASRTHEESEAVAS